MADIARKILEEIGVLKRGHFVLNSSKHASRYVAKDLASADPAKIDVLARILGYAMATQPRGDEIRVVVGPMEGAAVFANRVAYHIGQLLDVKVGSVWASKVDEGAELRKSISEILNTVSVLDNVKIAFIRDALENSKSGFAFRSVFEDIVKGQCCATVEDILTTGGTARLVTALTRSTGGELIGTGDLWNRGGITAEMIGVPWLIDLVSEAVEAHEYPCPQCLAGEPISTDLGHGKKFLAKHPDYPRID